MIETITFSGVELRDLAFDRETQETKQKLKTLFSYYQIKLKLKEGEKG